MHSPSDKISYHVFGGRRWKKITPPWIEGPRPVCTYIEIGGA